MPKRPLPAYAHVLPLWLSHIHNLQFLLLRAITGYHTTDVLPFCWSMTLLNIDCPQSSADGIRVREHNRYNWDQLKEHSHSAETGYRSVLIRDHER